ncbi:MAG TPA: hypothetical protein VGL56_00435 [Fimbriimonadaceae bacterium]|jgi:outer membrane protein assembly factor BamD (BamD/ComL family)
MSVGAVGSSASIYSAQQTQPNYFQTLQQDLSSGNLQGAQSAFAAIQQQFQSQGGTSATSAVTSSSSTSSSNPVSTDVSALGQALQSGNLSAAQQAFQSLQTAAKGAHHHHHHGGGSSSTSQTDSSGASAASLSGATLNITA